MSLFILTRLDWNVPLAAYDWHINTAMTHLRKITQSDPGLKFKKTFAYGVSHWQVTYNKTKPGPGQMLVRDLVAANVMTAIFPGTPNVAVPAPGPGSPPMADSGGITFWHPYFPSSVVQIVYDVTDCNGSNYWVLDKSGNQMHFPSYMVLYHELAHAWDRVMGSYSQAKAEFDAITMTNKFRSHVGEKLRDPSPPSGVPSGGCGFATGGSGVCLIVTATYQTDSESRVRVLQAVRDKIIQASPHSSVLVNEIQGEYYKLSPPIAEQLRNDEQAKTSFREFIVDPLIEFYEFLLEPVIRSGSLPYLRLRERVIQYGERTADIVALLSSIRDGLDSSSKFPPSDLLVEPRTNTGRMIKECLTKHLTDRLMPMTRYFLLEAVITWLSVGIKGMKLGSQEGENLIREKCDQWLSENPYIPDSMKAGWQSAIQVER